MKQSKNIEIKEVRNSVIFGLFLSKGNNIFKMVLIILLSVKVYIYMNFFN